MSKNGTMNQVWGDNILDVCDVTHEQLISLETAALEAALADGVIGVSHDNIRENKPKKVGLRRGKWTLEEENYANRLISEFKLGLLPLTDGTTLRTFLSKLLNCDPMRISKKFVGGKCIGKQVFRRRQQDLEKLTPDEIEASRNELADLERQFLERVAQVNRAKPTVTVSDAKAIKTEGIKTPNGIDTTEDHQVWNVHTTLLQPKSYDAVSSSSSNTSESNSLLPQSQYAYAHQQHSTDNAMIQSESSADMLEFQRLMASSSGALAGLTSEHQQHVAYQLRQHRQQHQDQYGSMYPRVSTLDVLCGETENRLESTNSDGMQPFVDGEEGGGGPHRNNSFPWGLNSPTLNGRHTYTADMRGDGHMDALNRNYYAQTDEDSGGAGAHMRYSSSAEWPSMNNLVVAAETIEHLGSMNSLLGGGLGSLSSMGAFTALNGPHTAQSGLQPISFDMQSGSGNDFVSYYRDSRLTPPVVASEGSGDHLAEANSDEAVRDEQQGDDVGYPLDEEDGNEMQSVGGLMQHSNGSSGQSPLNGTAGEEASLDNRMGSSPRDRAMSVCSDRGAASLVPNNSGDHHMQSQFHDDNLPQGSYGRKEAVSTHDTNAGQPSSTHKDSSGRRTISGNSHPMAKTSSVDNFWMLVDMGDLPQPDSDVLSMTLWQGGPTPNRSPRSAGHARSPTAVKTTRSSPLNGTRPPLLCTSLEVNASPRNNGEPRSPRITPDQLPPHLVVNHSLHVKHARDSPSALSTEAERGAESKDDKSSTDSMQMSDSTSISVDVMGQQSAAEEKHDTKRTRLLDANQNSPMKIV